MSYTDDDDVDLQKAISVQSEPLLSTPFVTIYPGYFLGTKSKQLAVKRSRYPGVTNATTLGARKERLASVVRTLRRAKHQNVAEVYGIYSFKGDVCIVTVWAAEGTLAAYLQRSSGSDIPRRTILTQIAAGLAYLHSELDCKPRIVHGNLHTGNVLIDEQHNALVCDYGLNGVLPSKTDESIVVLPDSLPRGKFIYVAPELHTAEGRLSVASDVFSFSILAWDVYTGTPPYLERGMVPAMLAIARGERPEARADGPVPPDLAPVIADGWAHDPAARPVMDTVYARLASAPDHPVAVTTRYDLFGWSAGILASIRSLWASLWKLWAFRNLKRSS